MSDEVEIKYLGELSRLDLKDGDAFVITTDMCLTEKQTYAIREMWKQAMPDHKVMILDCGLKMGVIGAEYELVLKDDDDK